MDFSYSQIKPLIVHEEVQGQRVFVEFQHPVSGAFIQAQGTIRRSNSIGDTIGRNVKRSFMQQARSSIMRTVGGLFGGGFIGRTARSVTSTASREMMRPSGQNAPSQSEIEAGVVAAFKTVQNQFHYDQATGKWGAPATPPPPREKTPFEAQIDKFPIIDPHDKKVFARIMASLANADGHIADEEVEFFNSVMPAGVGSLQELIASEQVSKVECEMIKDGVRETIYMFSWAIILADYELHPNEIQMIENFGGMLSIAGSRGEALAKTAKIHMLEQALDADMTRDELFELADSLQLDRDDAERAKINWVRRQG